MTDITKALLIAYSKLDKTAALREFVRDLCGATQDARDEFTHALEVAYVMAEVFTPPAKQRAPRKDKGTRRQPKPIQAVA